MSTYMVLPVRRVAPASIEKSQSLFQARSQIALPTRWIDISFAVLAQSNTPPAFQRGKLCYGFRSYNDRGKNLHWQRYFSVPGSMYRSGKRQNKCLHRTAFGL